MNEPRRIHPGAGRRRALKAPKGRQLDEASLAEVRALLGSSERRRDLLIEFLHRIQDAHGQLERRHLTALAHELRLSLAEVYEVATFYAHFEVVDDGAKAPRLTLRVCDSLSCALAGGEALLQAAREGALEGVRVVRGPCMGACDAAPVAALGHETVRHAKAEPLLAAARERLAQGEAQGEAQSGGAPAPAAHTTHAAAPPDAERLGAYRKAGGYAELARCLKGERTREEAIAELSDSGLRGLGGAGFPAGRKWAAVAAEPAPRLMTINADEGEPGTFKDRWCLATAPHRMLEGALIAAWAVEAEACYIYLRDEYPELHALLAEELAALEQAGLTRHCAFHLRRGAGAYICGEESAMVESLEGKRGLPRHRPPFIAQNGLFGRPTLNHNVETLWWIPEILAKPPGWFASHGRNGRTGLRLFSVSGRVARPGIKRADAGITLRELIAEHCGGMADGHALSGYLPGGASGGILPASLARLPLDFDTLQEHGCFIGSGAVVVLSDQDDLKAAALNLMRFFEDESCGQCTPCRSGTEKIVSLLATAAQTGETWDEALLKDLAEVMAEASICGLGQAAANPVLSLYRHFPETART